MELTDKVAAIIQRRYRLPESVNSLVDSYIDEAGTHIMIYLGYTSIRQIPEALKYTWANIAMAAFKAEQSHMEELDDILAGVAAVKIGDTTVEVGGSSGGITSAMNWYDADLRRFRKLRW